MKYRVTRILVYTYDNAERMVSDMAKWTFNHTNPEMTIRTASVLPELSSDTFFPLSESEMANIVEYGDEDDGTVPAPE